MKRHFSSIAAYNLWAHSETEKWFRNYLPITSGSSSNSNSATHTLGDSSPSTRCVPFYEEKLTLLPLCSVYNTFCHMWAADQLWLCRLRGTSHTSPQSLQLAIGKEEQHHQYNTSSINCEGRISAEFLSTFWTDNHENDGRFERLFRGGAPQHSSPPPPLSAADVEKAFAALQSSATELEQLIADQSDEDMFKMIVYHTTDGQEKSMLQSDILTHIFNHSTHHRGQLSCAGMHLAARHGPAGTAVKQLGLDMPIFYLSRTSSN